MKLLVLSIVLFVLLQLQCAQGASLAGKLQDDEQQTVDTEDEKELENEDMTNSETEEAHEETESLLQIGLHNTTADQEGSSLHESSELEDDLKNKSASQKLNHSSEEEINGKSSNIKSALKDTLKKNETMKRTLQTRLGVGATSALSLGVGSAFTNGPSSLTLYAAGADLETGVGMGLNSQQATATRPSITTSSQTDISIGVQEGSSTSNNLNEDLWPSTQDNLNTNAKGSIQSSQQQTRPATAIDSSASSTAMYNWPTYQSNLNTNLFASSIIQNNQQQTTPSVSPTSQIRPSTAMNPSASSNFNNWPTSQSNFNTNVFVGGSTETSQQQSRPSLTAGSQDGVTTTNHNRPFTASNAEAKLTANNWQTVNSGINTNAFAGGGIQNNAQQSGPSMATVSHAGVTTNQYSPSTEINANASYANNWQSMLGGLNSNAFAGGSIQTNQQPSRPFLTAGSQVEITAINQNRPTAGSNTNTMPPANTWMTVNGGINTNTLAGGGIQNNQPETRPSQTITTNSEVGISNQYMSTANGLSTNLPIQHGAIGYNGQTSGFPPTSHNSETSHQSQSLEPLTKISQLMKVVEVISNDSSANIPGPLGDEANVDMNLAQDSNLEQSSVTEGQDATKLNLQNNNVQPTNYSKLSLDDLTKIVQLLKVVEVISNATSEEEPQFNPKQNIIRDTDNPAFITYGVDGAMNSGSYLDNGLSMATQGNTNSDLALATPIATSRPTSGLGGPVTSHVPNYQNSYINNQVYQNSQFTASAGVNVIGETTSNLYKQFSPELTTSSTTANINFNNVASSEQIQSQDTSASSGQNYLAASGNSQAGISASPSSSGIKRRSLTSLVQTVDLLDAIETLANINNTEQKGNKHSEHLTSNTNHPAALQNGATISNNFNSNAVAQINAGFYSPQEMTQESYIDQRPSLAAQGEATQHVETGVNLSNMAEIKPTTTTNNQQNFRPTLSLENSKDTASQSVIPNYQQQTLMGGVAQAGIGNQYRPGSASLSSQIMTNIPTTQKDYNYNMNGFTGSDRYNVQQLRPSIMAGSQTGLNQSQYRPSAGISTNAMTLNNIATIQGGINVNEGPGSNQYREQQASPSVAEETQTGLSSDQYNSYVASNASAVTTINNTPTLQGGTNMNSQVNSGQYKQQTIRPSSAVGSQPAFVNNNQYRPLEVSNSNATTITNDILSKQDAFNTIDFAGSHQKNSQLSGQSLDVGNEAVPNRPNSALNAGATITVGNFPSIQEGLDQNTFYQNNIQQTRPSVATGTQSSLANNNLYTPTAATTTNGPTMTNTFSTTGEGKQTGLVNNYQHRPNEVFNTSTDNDSWKTQNGINTSDLINSNLYNEQQITPSVAAGSQIGLYNNSLYRTSLTSSIGTSNMVQNGYNQYRPSVALNTNAATFTNNWPITQGDVTINNDFSGNNFNNTNQQIVAGDKTGSINYNQYRPSGGFDANIQTTISNNSIKQGDYNINGLANQYGEQQLGTFVKAESQSGIINNNQYRPNASINGSIQNVATNFSMVQGDYNTNFNHENEQQMRPTVGSQTALINNQDRQNVTLNAGALTTANKLPTAQVGEINMNDYGGINQYNGLHIRPSVPTGNQKGFVNTNQSAHNTYLNANGRSPLTLNNMATVQGEFNMNGYGGIVQNNQQQFRPSAANGSQTGVVSGQSMLNTAVNENVLTTLSNLPTVSGVINMNNYNSVNQYKQQITPSVATETPTGFGNNQFSSNAASAIIANNSLTTQGGTNQNNQQQIIPSSTAAGTQSGMINNQVTPNLAFNLTTYNLPTTQSAIKINAFDKINQYNQQQIKPSVAAATQSGFGSINQYRPNAALNTSATATVNYPSTMQENIKQNDLGSYNQQQIRPSVAVGTQIGFSSNNQYRPNTPLNTSATATVNYTPAMQDDIKINGLTSLNQYNKQQIRPTVAAESQAGILNNNQSGLSFGLNTTGNAHGALKDRLKVNQSIAANQNTMQLNSPSVAAGTQTGFGSNNQYRPNATLNISATSTANYTPAIQNSIKINGLAGLNLYNEQQIRPTVAAESQAGILNNNQSELSFGLNTTGNAQGAVKDRLKVNQSIAANQNIMLNSPLLAVESQAGFGSKTQSKPNSVINANATTKLQSALAAGNQNQQKNQTFVKAESQVDLNKTSINNKPQMTQTNANSKDNLDQTSTQRFQGGTKINDKKQNADINNQEGSLQAKNSSTATTGNQLIPLKTIETKENSGINLNQQHTKQSNAGKTQVGSVSTINQQLPYAAINLSSSTPINNVFIPLVNPNVNTYATTNQIQPLAQVPVILNNPSLISESNVNRSSYNSKLNQDSSQNHTSEIIRNQLIHSIPTIQGQLVPSATGLFNNSQPTDDPLINGGSSQQKTTSMNNNQKIAINTLSIGLNVEGGTSVTNTKENNDTDKENSRSLASDVQVGNNSSHHSNSSTAKDSKTSGSTETQSKESEKSKSKISAQGNTDVGNIKIPANTVTKEHKTIGESQNQISATSTAEKSHIITNLTPSIASESNSHVDCIKKEPLSNGSISITNVGDCIMHQNHGNANQLDNMQVSGAASSSSVINGTPLNSSVGVNAIANSKNETNNIVTASSDASFNATSTDKSQVTT